eukprot:212078-Hanusia_phi.AAC.3
MRRGESVHDADSSVMAPCETHRDEREKEMWKEGKLSRKVDCKILEEEENSSRKQGRPETRHGVADIVEE